MKKLIAIVLATLMMFTLIAPASAATAVANEAETTSSTNIFDLITEFFHNIVGAITKIFNAKCPYCDGIHNEVKDEPVEDKYNGVDVSVLAENPVVTIDGVDYTLDVAYNFVPSESIPTDFLGYKYWHADFVITTDRTINDVVIAGQYDEYSENYVGLVVDKIKANQSTRIIQSFDSEFVDRDITVNVEELFTTVKSFNCGIASLDDSNIGANITVELRLYETEDSDYSKNIETGTYLTIATVNYTIG